MSELNRLRRWLEAVWWKGEPPAQLHLVPEDDYQREAVLDAYRVVAHEMGLHHIQLDLTCGLSADHLSRLSRQVPRMVVMLNIDRMPSAPEGQLREAVLSGPPTLPVIVVFGTQEKIDVVKAGWPAVRAAREAGRDPGAINPQFQARSPLQDASER